ncbi:MAG TPA: methylated-DNA--[protein]-cysteine S-methyltransferase [Candidatus Methanoperedenaceae archaeon]|nr:methylated-DNA--[protein]-cysteine S-methyltransferase [Candidatus Methanoperedenaceae archaeon]
MDCVYIGYLGCSIIVEGDRESVRSVSFVNKAGKGHNGTDGAYSQPVTSDLRLYFNNENPDFSKYRVCLESLTQFERRVLEETRRIRFGELVTYGELARRAGTHAVRATGNALAKNPVPIIIPCHRVVAARGIGGDSGGLFIKRKLIELERRGSQVARLNSFPATSSM